MEKKVELKVGDKVRILDGSKAVNYCGEWVNSMCEFVGKIGTITKIFDIGTRRGCLLSKGFGGYIYDLRYLQKVEEKAERGVDHKPTQNTRILDYMQEFGGITQLEALRDLSVMRLASRISDMRRLGYDIESETVPVKNRWGETCYIKRYKLGEKE